MDTIEIEGYYLQRVRYQKWEELKFPIYLHQANTIDTYEKRENILLCTKTGSGKTAAALFPVIKNGHSAFFVYPTNALIKNQVINIQKTLTRMLNKKIYIRNASLLDIPLDSNLCSNPADADICIHIINREILEAEGYLHRGEIIQSILHDPAKQTIILTNPDTLFAIFALSYKEHLNVVRALERYKTIVIDEFHMYYGVQLANIVFMLKFAEKLIPSAFQIKIFLSATSSQDLKELLEDLFLVKEPHSTEIYPEVDEYLTIHPITLKPRLLTNELPISTVVTIVNEIKDDLKEFRETNIKNQEYVPCVIIVNSVIDAIHIEEEIASACPDIYVRPYHGLMNKSERKINDAHIIVGTNAIEVGIDFQCSILIFDAGDAASFLQRFGRLGRHHVDGHSPVAYPFLPKHVYEKMTGKEIKKLSRENFEEIINKSYDFYPSYSGFVCSDYGMIQANIFIKKLQKLLERDGNISDSAKKMMVAYFEDLLKTFNKDKKRIERKLKLAKKWFNSYLESVNFRSTLPMVLVYDTREKRKGRLPLYDAEISTALAKGTPCLLLPKPEETYFAIMKKYNPKIKIKLNDNVKMVLISNYDYYYSLEFISKKSHEFFAPFVCNESDIFIHRKKQNYGFGALLEGHIAMCIHSSDFLWTDWRTKKFKMDDLSKLLVFDGDVLLYMFLEEKRCEDHRNSIEETKSNQEFII